MSSKRYHTIPTKKQLETNYNVLGATISSMARDFGTTNPTMRKWLKHHNIRLKTHKETVAEKSEILYNNPPKNLEENYQEHNMEELTKNYSVTGNTIRMWLDRIGVEKQTFSDRCKKFKRKRYETIQFQENCILDDLNSTKSKRITAENFGVSVSHIKKLLSGYGIQYQDEVSRSYMEKVLLDYCKEIRPDVSWKSGDRTRINPLELDIFSPELNFAIEYCGLYWHSEYYGGKNRHYHQEKWKRCKALNIDLITVFESDDIEKVKRAIRKRIGQQPKIYARQCSVIEGNKSDIKRFNRKYHMHNDVGSNVALSLVKDGEIVMTATFGKSRFDKSTWECLRMTSGDVTVVGGASKLFKHFTNKHDVNLTTFVDLRFGEGKVYEKCGLTFHSITPPNYWYFEKNKPNILHSRMKFQKHKLSSLLDHYDQEKTEFENMLDNGYDRIFDCGNAKYVLCV